MSDKLKVSIEVEVPPDVVEFVTGGPEGYVDVFMRSYCGYWAMCVKNYKGKFLVCTDTESGWSDDDCALAEACVAKGEPLPPDFALFDEAFAAKCHATGVRLNGLDWFENGDADTYDVVIQTALFGEVVYG